AWPPWDERAFVALCAERDQPYTPLGYVDGRSRALNVRGQFAIPLDELRAAWSGTLPRLFGGAEPSSAEPEPEPSAAAEAPPEAPAEAPEAPAAAPEAPAATGDAPEAPADDEPAAEEAQQAPAEGEPT